MHCSSLQLKVFATILFVAANAMNQANAQTSTPTEELKVLPATPRTPETAIPYLEPGKKFIIITSEDPSVKRTCRLASATADEIRCQQHSKTKMKIYKRADLEAIMKPNASRFDRLTFIFPLAIGGSIIWGACVLGAISAFAIIGAVPVGIIGAVFVLISLAIATDTEDYKSVTVLYQKPAQSSPSNSTNDDSPKKDLATPTSSGASNPAAW